jgi:hypothetical protein
VAKREKEAKVAKDTSFTALATRENRFG